MSADNQMPPMKPTARCRWCDRDDIAFDTMAIMSFKRSWNGFTGVCTACYSNPDKEAEYVMRMDRKEPTK